MSCKKPPKPPKSKPPSLSPEDANLWLEMTSDVKPLPGRARPKPVIQKAPESKKPEVSEILEVQEILPSIRTTSAAPRAPAGPGIDRSYNERLRRGKISIEARIDLHGMTQKQAEVALQRFILSAHHRGLRCVLVITGKGRERKNKAPADISWADTRPGVLKRAVPGWLAAAALAALILQTHPARPQHGGDGALYVLLRRRKS
jgi:DNA-nicking Smr family endonuclease